MKLPRLPRRALGLTLGGVVALAGACAGSAGVEAERPSRLTVLAAASLAESFEAIALAFEAQHPGLDVRLSLGGSSALATQVEERAPADVFASADLPQMQRVASVGLISGEPQVFARNALVVVVPAANRSGIARLEDLARPGVSVASYPPDLPIGAYTRQVLDNASRRTPGLSTAVEVNVRSHEPTVRSAVAKVELDEVDGALVYRTDAAAAGAAVRVIEIPAEDNVVAEYPMGVLAASRQRPLAEAFVAFVLGPEGQRILRDAGFEAPPEPGEGAPR